MNKEMKTALRMAMNIQYGWIENGNEDEYNYQFSEEYRRKMKNITVETETKYVFLGRHRIKKSLAAILIAAMLVASTGCAILIHSIIVNWNEKNNEATGTLDVTFDIEDIEHEIEDIGFVKPQTPEGFKIINEYADDMLSMVEYQRDETSITFVQDKNIQSVQIKINNEDNNLSETEINGHKGYSGYDETLGIGTMYWCDGVYLYSLNGNCKMEILEKMAESIK